jgi:uncharacterized protein YoxC
MMQLLMRILERVSALSQLVKDLIAVLRHNSAQLTHFLNHVNRRLDMTVNTDQLAAAITPLSDAVQGATTAITGIPQMITDAVTKALAATGNDDETTQQKIIDEATAEAVKDTKILLDAVNANLQPAPAPGVAPPVDNDHVAEGSAPFGETGDSTATQTDPAA